MLIPWAGDRETEQILLGRAMQVMYDDATVDGPELVGALAGTPTELRVNLATMQVDDRARIWWAINLPYHLSVNYEVRVVDIDATTQTQQRPCPGSRACDGCARDSGFTVVRLRGTPLSIDRIVAASPVWIRLVDTFRDALGYRRRRTRSLHRNRRQTSMWEPQPNDREGGHQVNTSNDFFNNVVTLSSIVLFAKFVTHRSRRGLAGWTTYGIHAVCIVCSVVAITLALIGVEKAGGLRSSLRVWTASRGVVGIVGVIPGGVS